MARWVPRGRGPPAAAAGARAVVRTSVDCAVPVRARACAYGVRVRAGERARNILRYNSDDVLCCCSTCVTLTLYSVASLSVASRLSPVALREPSGSSLVCRMRWGHSCALLNRAGGGEKRCPAGCACRDTGGGRAPSARPEVPPSRVLASAVRSCCWRVRGHVTRCITVLPGSSWVWTAVPVFVLRARPASARVCGRARSRWRAPPSLVSSLTSVHGCGGGALLSGERGAAAHPDVTGRCGH